MKKAVVLVSGGLDSATTLAIAGNKKFECHALSFDYGQRHIAELDAARKVADYFAVAEHKIITLDLREIGGSALTDLDIAVPEQRSDGIPITYVPARNTIFLSFALAWAEVLGIQDIFIGVNAVDYSGYPDCRPEYLQAYERLANLATRAGAEDKRKLTIHAPLLELGKAEIIRKGAELKVDYSITLSCYQPDDAGYACGKCESCRFRIEGFAAAAIADPARYRQP